MRAALIGVVALLASAPSAPAAGAGGAVAPPPARAARTVDVRAASLVLVGERRGDLAGASVASAGDVNGDGGAGDVNGDGLDDLLVSGRTAGVSGSRPSAVFVVFGKRDTARVDLAALRAGGYALTADGDFVTVLAGRAVGDVNGDGRADVGVA